MKAVSINTRKSQAGMTLTESLLVLAVGALVAVLAYAGYKMAASDVNQKSAIDSSARLLSAVKKTFGSTGKYSATVTTLNVAKSGIVPTDFTTSTSGAGSITAPWGGTTVTVVGSGASTATVTFVNVPTSLCLPLMAGVEGLTDSMTAGPTGGTMTAVKTSGGTFDSGAAGGQCAAAADIVATIK